MVDSLKADISEYWAAAYAELYFFNNCFLLLCKLQR